jgi:hypothetical protein
LVVALFHRVDGTQARLDRHAASAATLMQWFEGQAFATDTPALGHAKQQQRVDEGVDPLGGQRLVEHHREQPVAGAEILRSTARRPGSTGMRRAPRR